MASELDKILNITVPKHLLKEDKSEIEEPIIEESETKNLFNSIDAKMQSLLKPEVPEEKAAKFFKFTEGMGKNLDKWQEDVRAGLMIREGSKDVARGTLKGAGLLFTPTQLILDSGDKQTEMIRKHPRFKGYAERKAPTAAQNIIDIANSEFLAANPDATPKNFVEKVIRIGPQVVSQIPVAMATGFTGSAAFMGLQILGLTYEQQRAQGVPHDRAMWAGVANAMVQAPMEAIGISKLTKFIKVKGSIVNRLKVLGEAMGTEWLTEFLQGHPEFATNLFAQNPDKGLLESFGEALEWDNIKKWAPESAEEGLVVLPWAVLGGAGAHTTYKAPKIEEPVKKPTPIKPPKITKPGKKQPALADLKRGEQREPTAKEKKQQKAATDELGLTKPKSKPKAKVKAKPKSSKKLPPEKKETETIENTSRKDIQEIWDEATKKELNADEIKKKLKESDWHKTEELEQKIKYNELTQPAVQDKAGKTYIGVKTKEWSPTEITDEVAESVQKSFDEAIAKAGGKKNVRKRGFIVNGNFISAAQIEKQKKILSKAEERKVKKQIKKEEKLTTDAKEMADAVKRFKNLMKPLTPAQQGTIISKQNLIRNKLRQRYGNHEQFGDLLQAENESFVNFVRSGNSKGYKIGNAARNFLNKQGIGTRYAKEIGQDVKTTPLDEATMKGMTETDFALSKKEWEQAGKPTKSWKTATLKKITMPEVRAKIYGARRAAEAKKDKARAEARLTKEEKAVAKRKPEFSIIEATRRIKSLRDQLVKTKNTKKKEAIAGEIARIQAVTQLIDKEAIHRKAKEGGITPEDFEHKRYLETHGIIGEESKPSSERPMQATATADVIITTEEAKDPITSNKTNRRIARVTRRVLRDQKQSPWYSMIKAIYEKTGIKVVLADPTTKSPADDPANIIVQRHQGAYGVYSWFNKMIVINPRLFGIVNTPTGKIDSSKINFFIDSVVAHEALHAITKAHEAELAFVLEPFMKSLEKIIFNKDGKTFKKGVPKSLSILWRLPQYNKSGKAQVAELISRAFTDVTVAEYLMSLPAPANIRRGVVGNMWSWLKRIIGKHARSLGVPTKLDELSGLMDVVLDINMKEGIPQLEGVFSKGQIDKDTSMMVALNESNNKDGLVDANGAKFLSKYIGKPLATSLRFVVRLADIEAPWKAMGAARTGRVLRTFFSRKSEIQTRAINEARSFVTLARNLMGKITKEEWADIVFQSEDPQHVDTLDMTDNRKAAIVRMGETLNEFFESKDRLYKNRGIKYDFKKRLAADLQKKIDGFEDAEDKAKAQAKLEKLKRLRYVHIPVAYLFTKTIDNLAKKKGRTRFQISKDRTILHELLVSRKRHVLSIKEMVERKGSAITKKDIDPISIMMNYMHRVSEDMAMLDLKDAMLADKLIAKTKKKGWQKATSDFGIMQGSYIEGKTADMVTNLLQANVLRTRYDRAIAIAKMSAFYNPLFLPMYDIFQSVGMANSLFKTGLGTLIKNMGKAWTHVMNRTPEYTEAMKLGLFSKPFEMPWKNYKAEMESILKHGHREGISGFIARQFVAGLRRTKTIKQASIISAIYHASWATAWKLDECVRMFTYLQMQQGINKHNKLSAAETAAQFHGDYASVPPRTRRWANRFFFTPTFKIVMAKVYLRMAKSILKALIHPTKTTAHQRQMMIGAGSMVALNFAFDAFMRNFGFEEDEEEWWNLGRKYSKRIYTPLGPKELAITFSNPTNMIQRYLQKVMSAKKQWKKIGPFAAFLKVVHWDLHPFYTTLLAMKENKRPNGEPIAYENDSDLTILAKYAWFGFNNVVKIFSKLNPLIEGDDPVSKRQAKKYVNKVWGRVGNEILFGWFAIGGAYTRSPKLQRFGWEMKRRQRQFNTDQRKHFLRYGELNKEWMDNYLKTMKKTMREGLK